MKLAVENTLEIFKNMDNLHHEQNIGVRGKRFESDGSSFLGLRVKSIDWKLLSIEILKLVPSAR